jgi:hypothetical protein
MACWVDSPVSLSCCANKRITGSRCEASAQSASHGRHFCIQIRDKLPAEFVRDLSKARHMLKNWKKLLPAHSIEPYRKLMGEECASDYFTVDVYRKALIDALIEYPEQVP